MSAPSSNTKGKRAVAQERSTTKAKGRPSLLKRLTSPACGGLLSAMSPAAQRKELERLAAQLEYTDDQPPAITPKSKDKQPPDTKPDAK